MIVLASSSPHRRALLDRLSLHYETCTPDIDETRPPSEDPEAYVARLSREKARAVVPNYPHHLIIGSDQAAVLDGEVIGKPGNHENARHQLERASGRCVRFLTGITLLNSSSSAEQTRVVPFEVQFRQLGADHIERYLLREQPYACAGSFKSEALGIALFERMNGEDPTALVGLPLITLVSMLANEGVIVP